VNFITFNSTAGAYTLNATTGAAGLAGGTPLTVKGDIINNANSTQTIDMNLALLPTSTGIINAVNGNMSAQTSSSNITISSNISGAGGIIKQGNGSLTLSGANTYNGTTTINSGTVFVTSNTALGSTAGGTTINGGKLVLNSSGLSTSENITIDSTTSNGDIALFANATISGLITLRNSNGDIRSLTGSPTLTLTGGVTTAANRNLNFATSAIINTTPITIGTGTLGFQTGSNQLNVAGNTYGQLNLGWNGVLTLGVSNALASTANVIFGGNNLTNNAFTLSLNGTNQTISGLAQDSTWAVTDGQNQNVTGGGVLTVNQTSNATRSYGGRITDGATATSLVKNGSGTLMLQNWSGINSSYSGATTINAGTLMILAGNGTSLSANSSYTVASGAVLTLGGNSTVAGPATAIIGSLAGAGTVQNGNATTVVTLTAGGNNATTTFSGVLQNGGAAALALTKNGTGTFTLTGNNTYSGNTTVNAGTLGLDGRLSGNTAITIAGSGALTQSSTGVISGASSFTHNSSGTSTLAGNNTYSGTTTVSAGTLTLSGANTGGGAVVIDSVLNIQGNLTFAGNNQMTVGSSTAGIVNHSAGTVTFAAGNNLQLLIGNGVTPSGTYNLSGNGVLSIGASSNRGIMIGVNSGTAGNLANSAFNMSGGTITNSSDLMIGRHDWTTSYMNATYSQTGGNATHTNLKLGGSAGNGANSNVFLTLTGGNFTATNFTSLAAGNSVNATITIGGNAVVNLPAFATTRGTGSNAYLVFDGGTLRPTASSSAYLGGLTSATIRSGGATFDTNGNNITVSQALLANATSTGGGLTKNGTGTLTLTGNNTYTGTTTINAGTIEIGAAGLLGGGSYSGNIANSGLLIYSGTNNQTLSGILSGNGALTQNNTGTLTLSGANTYTGTTTINAGTLAIGANMTMGAFAGTGNLSLGTGYTLTTNTSATNTFSGLVIGNGALTKNGTGWLTLGGNNTYAGATTINAGTLEIGAAGRLGGGTYAGNIANTATFLYSGTNNQILSGILSGNGSFAQNAASTLTLTGNNTYTGATTIYDGTIEIGATGRLGGGTYAGNIANSGVLIYSGTNDQTLSGVISSVGALTHNASSTLTLSGNNTYSGGTTLNTGTLVIGNAAAAGTGTITQANGSSLLKIDTTGTITNDMSVYNVLASQSATLSGAITVNNATWDIDTGDTLTISGVVSGNAGVTKNGGGTLVLSGNNTYLAPTVINAGTLNAASVNALGSNNTVTVNGGSLLVSTDDAINAMTVTLNSTSTNVAGLAFSGNYSGLVDNLTLSKNSIIDLGNGSVSIMFDTFVMNSFTLDIYNWTGTTLSNGGTGNDTDKVYFGPDLSDAALAKIYFHSGAVGGGDSFLGSGYDLGLQQTSWDSGLEGYHIIPVPEPETYATGLLLLLGSAWWMWRNRKLEAGNRKA
jgi:autotransporter-associated beta strand protein